MIKLYKKLMIYERVLDSYYKGSYKYKITAKKIKKLILIVKITKFKYSHMFICGCGSNYCWIPFVNKIPEEHYLKYLTKTLDDIYYYNDCF